MRHEPLVSNCLSDQSPTFRGPVVSLRGLLAGKTERETSASGIHYVRESRRHARLSGLRFAAARRLLVRLKPRQTLQPLIPSRQKRLERRVTARSQLSDRRKKASSEDSVRRPVSQSQERLKHSQFFFLGVKCIGLFMGCVGCSHPKLKIAPACQPFLRPPQFHFRRAACAPERAAFLLCVGSARPRAAAERRRHLGASCRAVPNRIRRQQSDKVDSTKINAHFRDAYYLCLSFCATREPVCILVPASRTVTGPLRLAQARARRALKKTPQQPPTHGARGAGVTVLFRKDGTTRYMG